MTIDKSVTALVESNKDLELVEKLGAGYRSILEQLSKIIVGQSQVIQELLISLFARGHCLIVGVPGLAKTLLISSLAEILDLDFKRIQFTPDLMPSDITGTEVIEEDPLTRKRSYRFLPGPIFTNILLADEINRTPPKTQSALLQAMQEYKVTSGGKTVHRRPEIQGKVLPKGTAGRPGGRGRHLRRPFPTDHLCLSRPAQ